MNIPYVMRKCTKCGEWKVASIYNFSKNKKCKFRLKSICKICDKKYYKEHKEEISEKQKEYNNKHKEEISIYKSKYYEEHKEEISEKHKQYRKENKDKVSESKKKDREKHKEYYKEYHKKHYRENPEKYFNYCNKRRSKLENQGRGITKEQWLEMMMFFDFKCAYSGEYIGGDSDKRTIDHIVALSKEGENEPWNCIPMYADYNNNKKTKDMLEWYLKQSFFSIDRLTKIYEWRIYAYEKWGNVN